MKDQIGSCLITQAMESCEWGVYQHSPDLNLKFLKWHRKSVKVTFHLDFDISKYIWAKVKCMTKWWTHVDTALPLPPTLCLTSILPFSLLSSPIPSPWYANQLYFGTGCFNQGRCSSAGGSVSVPFILLMRNSIFCQSHTVKIITSKERRSKKGWVIFLFTTHTHMPSDYITSIC